jgi:hypothetical protein
MHSIVRDGDCTACEAVTVHARHSEICISKMLVIVRVSQTGNWLQYAQKWVLSIKLLEKNEIFRTVHLKELLSKMPPIFANRCLKKPRTKMDFFSEPSLRKHLKKKYIQLCK